MQNQLSKVEDQLEAVRKERDEQERIKVRMELDTCEDNLCQQAFLHHCQANGREFNLQVSANEKVSSLEAELSSAKKQIEELETAKVLAHDFAVLNI